MERADTTLALESSHRDRSYALQGHAPKRRDKASPLHSSFVPPSRPQCLGVYSWDAHCQPSQLVSL